MAHIFLSYSSKDTEFADAVETELRQNDYVVWRDRTNIRGGDDFGKAIESALREAWVIILIQSPHSRTSRWVGEKSEFARSNRIPIVPILLSGEPWFGFLRTQYIDVRERADSLLPDELYSTLLKHAPAFSLEDELDVNLIRGNTGQRLSLIPILEEFAANRGVQRDRRRENCFKNCREMPTNTFG